MLQRIIYFILRTLARAIIHKYKPTIVAVTGSVGKTSTKEAIYTVVSSQFSARRPVKSYNNQIGVPLTIIGVESSPGRNVLGWLAVFLKAELLVLFRQKYPEVLVLEYGADRPGDIRYLCEIAKPHISVVTAVGEIPVHVEFYAGPKEVAKEKQALVEVLEPDGYAILNYDDDTVFDMKHQTRANALTYGFGEGAMIRATDLRYVDLDWERFVIMGGLRFKISTNSNDYQVHIPRILGKPQIYSALAAIAVAKALDIKIPNAIAALHNFKAQPGRLSLLKGIKNTWIIDDSYNAAPQAMHAALDILGQLKAKRKIAVLGDMREIGKYTFEAHQAIGDRAAQVADILLAIGDKAKVIAQEAKIKGLDEKRIFWFDISERDLREAGKKLQEIIKPGDLILVKGSQAIRLEKIVEEIMAEPEKVSQLLVRQDATWKRKPVV